MNDFLARCGGLLKDNTQRLHSLGGKSAQAGVATAPGSDLEGIVSAGQNLEPKKFLLTLGFYLLQALIVAWILSVDLALPGRNLAVPINYRGDAIFFLMMVKAVVREGWWWHVHSLSAPFGADLVGMPLLGDFDAVVVKFIALFTHQAGLVLNLFWFFTIIVAGTTSTWSMLRLEIQRWAAFVLGILYAVSPHIFYRNEAHLMLSHHLIPLVALLAIFLCVGRSEDLRGVKLWVPLAGCALMGLSYAYFAFFSCFILLVGGAAGYLRTRQSYILRICAIATATVAATFALALLPSAMMWATDASSHKLISYKSPAEADVYGLRIRQLIDPTIRNPIPFLVKLDAKEEAAQFPFEHNESRLARLGTIASLGFLASLAMAVFFQATQKSRRMQLLQAIGVLVLGCVLLGTVGGFGSIFNLLVAPDVRCYTRISIFIAFFSIAAFGVILTALLESSAASLRKYIPPLDGTSPGAKFSLQAGGAILLGSLLWFGVVDQDEAPSLNWMQTEAEAKFHAQSAFVKEIEGVLPRDAMVYQLPDVPFAEGPHDVNRMFSNDHAEIFAVSDRVRWSWPATSTAATDLAEKLKSLREPELVDALVRKGFQGIFIDRFGYTDNGDTLIADLTDDLGRAPMQSENGRYAFFSLARIPKRDALSRREYHWGTPLFFGAAGNARRYVVAGWGPDLGTEGKESTMFFGVSPAPNDVLITARIAPALFANITVRPVKIFVNDTAVGEWEVRKPDWYSVTVPRAVAQKRAGLSLRFELPNAASPHSFGINNDLRVLSVAFGEMKLSLQ